MANPGDAFNVSNWPALMGPYLYGQTPAFSPAPQQPQAQPQSPGVMDLLSQTWPARLAKAIYGAVTLPGDVYQGNVQVMGPDGHTNPEVINRAADLAGLVTGGGFAAPAERNAVGAGVRAYQSAPDSLMGFRNTGPNVGFEGSNFPHTQYVQVTLKNGDTFVDAIKGMNQPHAVERAYRNWDAADVKPISEAQAIDISSIFGK